MKQFGLILSIVGGLILLLSFATDTAPEGTHNLGLMQGQMMTLSLGSLLLLVGAVIGAIGHALARMEEAGLLPSPGVVRYKFTQPRTK